MSAVEYIGVICGIAFAACSRTHAVPRRTTTTAHNTKIWNDVATAAARRVSGEPGAKRMTTSIVPVTDRCRAIMAANIGFPG